MQTGNVGYSYGFCYCYFGIELTSKQYGTFKASQSGETLSHGQCYGALFTLAGLAISNGVEFY